MSIKQQMRRVRLAVVALGLIGVAPSAFAAGTDTNYNTDISNTASVNYSVSGVPQTVINSSPGPGNSIPGAGGGTATTFEVDKRIMFIAEETNGAATVTSPGLTQVVTVFRVTNTSNGAQDFRIAADNIQPPAAIFGRPDAFDMSNFTLHISAAACSTATMTTPTYAAEPATTLHRCAGGRLLPIRVRALGHAGVADGRQRSRVDDPSRGQREHDGFKRRDAGDGERCGRQRRCRGRGVRRNRHRQRQRRRTTVSAWRSTSTSWARSPSPRRRL